MKKLCCSYPALEEFLAISRESNLIPVYREIPADLDTPVSSYLKLKKGEYSFLLESVEGQEKVGRYSFLGTKPSLVFKSKGDLITLIKPGNKQPKSFHTSTTPLDEIKKIFSVYRPAKVKGLLGFNGGFVGYIGYDMVRFFENIPDKNKDDLGLPDCVLMLADTLLMFDHVNHSIKIICNVFLGEKSAHLSKKAKAGLYARAEIKINQLERELCASIQGSFSYARASAQDKLSLRSNLSKSAFCGMVKKAKKYIYAGDIIQTVLSQRFEVKSPARPFDVYRALRSLNPSPYMFFLSLGDIELAGSSPETLVRCQQGIAETRPIAGTRPRGSDEDEDTRLKTELLADAKEKAEHVMLVDLGRNDLGRVCIPGSVKVQEFMKVEKYSHVMHIVSSVSGQLNKGSNSFDVLEACFPAGTLSGSPKIRAMEIIDELENSRRGVYGGCVGYFGFSGDMDVCITIRTILFKNRSAYVQAGAGIVADSIPEKEYGETVNKAGALLQALSLARK